MSQPINPSLRELYERKSVRVFTEQPIDAAAREAILRAAVEAPTAGNQQLYTILEITSQDYKEHLAKSCDNQPFIAKAPLVLIFCADAQKWLDAYRLAGCSPRAPGEGDLLLAIDDALIAAQNAVTAAWSLGIGSCYIGDIMEAAEVHRSLLELPDYVFPAALVVFGYPTEQQSLRQKPQRCDLDLIVQENTYRRLRDDELRRMTAPSDNGDFRGWTQAFCERKYNSIFSREMTRSVRRYLEAYRPKDAEED